MESDTIGYEKEYLLASMLYYGKKPYHNVLELSDTTDNDHE